MEEESQVQPTPFDAFPADVRADIDGLVWLGYLEDAFSFCGHDFVIRTLRGDEELMAALAIKDYVETLGQAKAHIWSIIGLSLVSVDGSEDFCPPATPNKKDYARARFNWVSTNWLWPLGLFIYNKYSDLIERQRVALEALEDFCSGSQITDLPSFGSWIGKESSEEPEEDIRDYLDDSAPSSSDS